MSVGRLVPGLTACVVAAAVALAAGAVQQEVVDHVIVEPLVVALVLGIVAGNAWRVDSLVAGTSFAARGLLEVAIVLLGLTLDAGRVLAAGIGLLGLIVAGVSVALVAGYAISRVLGLAPRLAILVAVGNAICGNAAIVAVAPVIGAAREQVAAAIALTAVVGVAMVLALPVVLPAIGLDDYRVGVVAGMSVYSVPQVVAASFPVSQLAGQVATLVKLIRVVLLGPVVVLISIGARRFAGPEAPAPRWTSYLPWFVTGFVVLAAVRTIGLVPDAVVDGARGATTLLMTVAMAGLGYGVRLADVASVGPRVGVAVVGALACLVAITLLLLVVLGIGA